jgi:uncharacterized protein
MIVETIFSTLDETGKPNFAPMGIVWGKEFITVLPFRNTHTCRNLLSTGYGIANVSDNVLAYVRCALYDAVLPSFPAKVVPGAVFKEACSWREVTLVSQAGTSDRAELYCRVLFDSRQRDFLGFRRASNAVIEATILATRLDFQEQTAIIEGVERYQEIVEKTGDESDKQAYRLVHEYVQQRRKQ